MEENKTRSNFHNNNNDEEEEMQAVSLIETNLKRLRVSSTLNKNTREFGKDFMIDGNDETCWNSHQGSPQSISIEFKQAATLNSVQIMFQGGFTGKNCEFWVRKAGGSEQDAAELVLLKSFYPEDKNTMQVWSSAIVDYLRVFDCRMISF